MNQLYEVFGTSRSVPKTYTTRPVVDDRFVNDITRTKHIVLHGSSKQGKTCLRKYHLKPHEHIVIQCTRETTKAHIYEMILKHAGIPSKVTSERTTRGTLKVRVQVSGSARLPLLAKGEAEGEAEGEGAREEALHSEEFDIDIEDPNDIVRVLARAGFKRLIVVEDFHYLDEDVQKSVAVDLKVFHEISDIVFVVVGVWLEANRLVLYNGDLNGRLSTIDVDKWEQAELSAVVATGCRLLNIAIPESVVEHVVVACQGNVGLLQELCFRLCEKHDVWHTQAEQRAIGTIDDIDGLARAIADSEAVRYQNFLGRFAAGLGDTQLDMYRWLAYAVIEALPDDLKRGLRTASILKTLKDVHPRRSRLQYGNVAQALERVATVQAKHRLHPIVLDYSNGELRVVDAGFLVFLRTHDETELLSFIGLERR